MSRDKGASSGRRAVVRRSTRETQVHLELDLDTPPDGRDADRISTGVGFFDHMLDALSSHGRFDLRIDAKGDLHIDQHHLVEDVGIALGTAFREALGSDLRIVRFASAYAPLDESLARAVVDISGRSTLGWGVEIARARVGEFDTDLVEEFFTAFTSNARLTLHLDLIRGTNAHHQIEAVFKATALALRQACQRDAALQGVPSTKGALGESDARGGESAS